MRASAEANNHDMIASFSRAVLDGGEEIDE